jgi:polysaccharide export outer membrane protein
MSPDAPRQRPSLRLSGRGALRFALLFCVLAVPAGGAEYRLQAGDVIEISISGPPDVLRRVTVQLDGSLPIPMAGRVAAAGATPAEVEARIQAVLASRPLRSYALDGRELTRFIDREQISVAVVEYRPVSIAGGVVRPGEHPFRPGMTVRHLVAAAGGFGRPEPRPPDEAARLSGDYAVAWITLAAQHARLSRLRSELGEEEGLDLSALPPAPVPDRTIAYLIRREAEFRVTRATDHAREKAYLAHAVQQADLQIAALTEQLAKEEAGVEADTEEMDRTNDLRARGMVTQARVIDARRVLLFSSTRALQASAQLGSVRRQRGELQRDLERADDRLRMRILTEVQEVLPQLAASEARLTSIAERFRLAGLPVPTGEPGEPAFVVVRTGERGAVMLAATLQTALRPGDVVQVGDGATPLPQGGLVAAGQVAAGHAAPDARERAAMGRVP